MVTALPIAISSPGVPGRQGWRLVDAWTERKPTDPITGRAQRVLVRIREEEPFGSFDKRRAQGD